MADRKPAKKGTKESAKGTAASDKKSTGFTAEERAAMNERAKEAKAEARGAGRAEGEKALLEKIAEMPKADRVMAKRIHEIVTATAGPQPRTTVDCIHRFDLASGFDRLIGRERAAFNDESDIAIVAPHDLPLPADLSK